MTIARCGWPSLRPIRRRSSARPRQLEAMLMAPCCWAQQVSLHQSPAADEIKQNIRRSARRGQDVSSKSSTIYVAEYGDRILAEPPARGFSAPDLRGAVGVPGRRASGWSWWSIRRLRAVSPAPAQAEQAARRPTTTRRSASTKSCATWTEHVTDESLQDRYAPGDHVLRVRAREREGAAHQEPGRGRRGRAGLDARAAPRGVSRASSTAGSSACSSTATATGRRRTT